MLNAVATHAVATYDLDKLADREYTTCTNIGFWDDHAREFVCRNLSPLTELKSVLVLIYP